MSNGILFFMIIMIIFTGLTMGLTPYISRKEMPFGISMPLTKQTVPMINARKKSYLAINFGLSIVLCILLLLLWQFGHKREETIIYFSTISFFILLIVSFITYIRENNTMKQYKKTLNLPKENSQKVFIDLTFREKTLILPTSYLVAINLVFILVTVLVTFLNYPRIPEQMVVHWDSNWQPNRIVDKSWLAVLDIPFFQVFITIVMSICNQSFSSAKQEINPNDPKKSLNQDKKFRKSSSLFIYIISIIMQYLFMIIQFFIIFPNQKSLKYLMIGSTFFVPILLIIVTLWYVLFYGQGGERLDDDNDSTQRVEQQVQDDRNWKWGMFYYNREDPSFWVEKRAGVGVTVNFAKWEVWVFLILTLVIPLAITFLMM